jgi:hypothetical protein
MAKVTQKSDSRSSILYGLMLECESAEALIRAAEKAHAEGYRRMDGYSPFPIEGLNEALGARPTRLPRLVLAAGILGFCVGFGMQYYSSVIDYPLNIGGKPLNSAPSFIPVAFELTILFASFAAAIGMLWFNGLPQPYHPVFHVDEFERASRDGFFLCIEADDPKFDRKKTETFMRSLKAGEVHEVAR